MRIAGFITTSFIILLLACNKKNKPPRHILGQEKMEAVLWDIMRADQFVFAYILPKDTTKKKDTEARKLYTQIFSIHQIDEKQFRESFVWYKNHPERLAVIMDSISTRASQLTEPVPAPAIVAITDSAPKKTDSIGVQAGRDTARRRFPIKAMKAD